MSAPSPTIPTPELPPPQPLGDLPHRVRGASAIIKAANSPSAGHYNEASVGAEFARAGFEHTKPYVPKHSLNPTEALANNRDPERTWRVAFPAGRLATSNPIRNDQELSAVRRHYRDMRDQWGDRISPESAAEWGNLVENTHRAASRTRRPEPHPVGVTRPRPTRTAHSLEPKRHGRSLLSFLRRG